MTKAYLHGEPAVGVEDFGLRFGKHLLEPLLHHLREAAGPGIISSSHKLQHWKVEKSTSLSRRVPEYNYISIQPSEAISFSFLLLDFPKWPHKLKPPCCFLTYFSPSPALTAHWLTCFQLEAAGRPGSPRRHRQRQRCDQGEVLPQVRDQLIAPVRFQAFQHHRGGVDSVPPGHVIRHGHVGGAKHRLHLGGGETQSETCLTTLILLVIFYLKPFSAGRF